MYPRPNPIWDGVRDDALTALETAVAAGSHVDPERLARILAQVAERAGQG
ncbi:hypothetical protein [Actinomadura sp. DC4]|nr:hypothetical protein [Actinomadura sp. DC4]MDN3356067.1 hypothetical protein [Actinomadura sp. DC4]